MFMVAVPALFTVWGAGLTVPGPPETEALRVKGMETLPILSALYSVNQSAPSGPEVITCGQLFAVRPPYSVTICVVGSILPILSKPSVSDPKRGPLDSVNQIAPSGPEVISHGPLPAVRPPYSSM